MISALKKPINDLIADDLRELPTKQWPESENVEFKGELPSKQRAGGNAAWTERREIVEHARRQITKAVVGFANRSGGRFFLGIEETADKPPRAAKLRPIPECHRLAEQLERCAREQIEPPISEFYVRGIETESDGTTGVVVFHIGQSIAGAHRSKFDNHCYIRRGNESKPMSMSEIQDLTLHLSRHLDEISKTFDTRRSSFEQWLFDSKPPTHLFGGVRVTALPVGAQLYIQRVFGNQNVSATLGPFEGTSSGGSTLPFSLSPFDCGSVERSILRGTKISKSDSREAAEFMCWCDGTIEFRFKWYWNERNKNCLYLSNLLGTVGAVLVRAERFREACATPDAEYGVEVEIVAGGDGTHSDLIINGLLPTGTMGSVAASEMPLRFERYSLGGKDELINGLLTDILDVCENHMPRPVLKVFWPEN